ncbi:MAG: aminodeoxychorismate/anthranilate synthase component II [Gemmatimonadetes bacterium]|nr:aminodeoxychorismate/anthranilate synthase component II [Gemmatimonadota bacterium]
MILLIDNYDSFTWNLAQMLGELGGELCVVRNDAHSVHDLVAMCPTHVVISPGPGRPEDAGVTIAAVAAFAATAAAAGDGGIPILGVCLGHQAIAQVYGGRVVQAPEPVHGKAAEVRHDGRTLFAGLPELFSAGRYHSLIVEDRDLPSTLEVSARSADGLVMGLRHRHLAVEGVQFHPESILTPHGRTILRNFLELGSAWEPGAARRKEPNAVAHRMQ